MALPDITRISPNKTPGWNTGEPHIIIVHGTRGGALYGREFDATLNWFDSEASQVSAHWVIGFDGRTARVVPDSHRAWHAAEHNEVAIGIELEQPNASDQITIPQYEKLALIGKTYYPSITARHLTTVGAQAGWIEHMETPQGIGMGKTDVGTFVWQPFLALLRQEDDMTAEEYRQILREELAPIKYGIGVVRGKVETTFNEVREQASAVADVVRDELADLEAKVDAIQSGTAPQKVRFPGATIKVPPVDMPVE